MSADNKIERIAAWIKLHPGVFFFEKEPAAFSLLEIFSQKKRIFKNQELERLEERVNSLDGQSTYLALLLASGRQLLLCDQGFAFAPDFVNTGFLSLPNAVYCMQDFRRLLNRAAHLAQSEARRGEALQLVTVLIALLDGAQAVGLNIDAESLETEALLGRIEC